MRRLVALALGGLLLALALSAPRGSAAPGFVVHPSNSRTTQTFPVGAFLFGGNYNATYDNVLTPYTTPLSWYKQTIYTNDATIAGIIGLRHTYRAGDCVNNSNCLSGPSITTVAQSTPLPVLITYDMESGFTCGVGGTCVSDEYGNPVSSTASAAQLVHTFPNANANVSYEDPQNFLGEDLFGFNSDGIAMGKVSGSCSFTLSTAMKNIDWTQVDFALIQVQDLADEVSTDASFCGVENYSVFTQTVQILVGCIHYGLYGCLFPNPAVLIFPQVSLARTSPRTLIEAINSIVPSGAAGFGLALGNGTWTNPDCAWLLMKGVWPNITPYSPEPTPTCSPAPSASPPSTANVYHGCQVYPAGDTYANNDIYNATPAANSASIISNWSAQGFTYGDSQSSEEVNLATNATALFTVQPGGGTTYTQPIDGVAPAPQVPWVDGFAIEGTFGQASDGHAQVLNTDTCVESDFTNANWTSPSGPLKSFAGEDIDLSSSYASQIGAMRQDTVAWIPIFGFTDYGEEASYTSINHPLSFFVSNGLGAMISKNGYFAPAKTGYQSVGTCTTGNSCLHLGDYIRLHSTFDCSPYTAKAQLVCNQLKHYGAVFDDDATGANGFRFGLSTSGTKGWSYTTDLGPLFSALHFSDFDIIENGTLQCSASPCN